VQADIYMAEPVFLVTNKTAAKSPWEGNPDPRVYFSLSDYYWPFQVSSVNKDGLPYVYNASRNLQVLPVIPRVQCTSRCICMQHMHVEVDKPKRSHPIR
jgi:hypothetical protein